MRTISLFICDAITRMLSSSKNLTTLTDAAKPVPPAKKVKWTDWKHPFINYLRTIVDKDEHHVRYVCKPQDVPEPSHSSDFFENYVAMAPLTGEPSTIDSVEVLTLIINFIAGNETAEAKKPALCSGA